MTTIKYGLDLPTTEQKPIQVTATNEKPKEEQTMDGSVHKFCCLRNLQNVTISENHSTEPLFSSSTEGSTPLCLCKVATRQLRPLLRLATDLKRISAK